MTANQELCLSIDLGGTTLMVGAVDRKGKVLASKTYPTGYRDQNKAAQAILAGVENFLSDYKGLKCALVTAGAGLVGQADPSKGLWRAMYRNEKHFEIPLAQLIEERWHLPCFLDNDVKTAALAELTFGEGKNYTNLIYLNVGTGIAAAIVSEGRILRGEGNNAGEIGHLIVDPQSDLKCFCGSFGCVEALASGRGIEQHYKKRMGKTIKDGEKVDARQVLKLAKGGDPLAKEVVLGAAAALRVMIHNLIAIFSPAKLIFSGGVVSDGWLLQKAQKGLKADQADKISISKLDAKNIGLMGASVLGFQGLETLK